jgi:phosphohistidine phosphatase SixA
MKLYLIQHGEAKTEKEDPERSLTERGEEEVNPSTPRPEGQGLPSARDFGELSRTLRPRTQG